MGMFDSFYFEDGILPDNKAPIGHEFQTKDLHCCLDKYYVKANHRIEPEWGINGPPDDTSLNFTAGVYSHEFLYDNEADIVNRKYLGSKYQHYTITAKDGVIVNAVKDSEAGYAPAPESCW